MKLYILTISHILNWRITNFFCYNRFWYNLCVFVHCVQIYLIDYRMVLLVSRDLIVYTNVQSHSVINTTYEKDSHRNHLNHCNVIKLGYFTNSSPQKILKLRTWLSQIRIVSFLVHRYTLHITSIQNILLPESVIK